MNNNVYINDLGIVNALGCGKQEVLSHLLSGHSAGMQERAGWLFGKETRIGQVLNELPTIPEELSEYDSRTSQLLLCAFQQIEKTSSLFEKTGAVRVGVVIGTSTSGIAEGEAYIKSLQKNRLEAGSLENDKKSPEYDYRQQEIGSPALFVAEYMQSLGLDVSGPCLTVSTACSSSAKVFATARNWLQMDLCDVVIAGGADSLCKLTVNGFNALGLVSEKLCQPFQKERDGINIGEAAAVFVLSKEKHTQNPIRLLGVGETSDAHHISAPHPEGLGAEAAMRTALSEANLKPEELDYINAHGTATPANDAAESQAIYRVFGDKVPCTSTKPLTGHTLGAAGATEIGFCWLLLQQNIQKQFVIPAQVNYKESRRDSSDVSPIYIPSEDITALKKDKQKVRALSNSFAFGGSNVSVIVGSEVITQ